MFPSAWFDYARLKLLKKSLKQLSSARKIPELNLGHVNIFLCFCFHPKKKNPIQSTEEWEIPIKLKKRNNREAFECDVWNASNLFNWKMWIILLLQLLPRILLLFLFGRWGFLDALFVFHSLNSFAGQTDFRLRWAQKPVRWVLEIRLFVVRN